MMRKQILILFLMGISIITSAQGTYQKFISAAKRGDADAQYRIGSCYHTGADVEKDEKKAVYWWGKAAKKGHAISQGLLGNAYDGGKGVKQDSSKAVYWFSKAAEQGLALAQTSLALHYILGRGVQKDRVKSAYWFRKAAEQGYAEGQYWLGVCYSNGWGVSKDEIQAFNWYRNAAEQGHANAQMCVGYLYAYGKEVPKDFSQSAYWLQKSIDNGESKANTYLVLVKKKMKEIEIGTKEQYRSKALNGEIKGILSYDVPQPFGKNGIFESGDTVCIVGYAESGSYKFYALYSEKNAGTFRPSTSIKKTFENEDKIDFKSLPDIDDPDVKLVIQKQKAIVDSKMSTRPVEYSNQTTKNPNKVSTQTKHLTIMGIPIAGSIVNFQQKLIAKNYRLDSKENKRLPVGQRAFKGRFSGHECSLRVYYFPDDKTVYKVRVSIDFISELNADGAYKEIKRNLLRKYKYSDTRIKSTDGHESLHALIIDDDDDMLGFIDLIVFEGDDTYESELVVGYTDMDGFAKEEKKHTDDL